MVTFPHWAEGSVAVVGLPAGGSWRRGAGFWDPRLYSLGSRLCGRTCLSHPHFPVFPPTAWGLAKESLAPSGHGSSGAFCGKCLPFSAPDCGLAARGQPPALLRGFPVHRLLSPRLRCHGPFSSHVPRNQKLC